MCSQYPVLILETKFFFEIVPYSSLGQETPNVSILHLFRNGNSTFCKAIKPRKYVDFLYAESRFEPLVRPVGGVGEDGRSVDDQHRPPNVSAESSTTTREAE
ncbi:unnamed protein product, partial [Nesidiocoris tenuis]